MVEPESIGIISPYRSQVELLRRELVERGKLGVKVSTIDGYQEREEDIIIISMVRSNTLGEIGFLGDYRRINVAVTRARMQVIIVGDSTTICCRPFLRRLVDYIKEHGAVFRLNKEEIEEKPKLEEEIKQVEVEDVDEERNIHYYNHNRGRQNWYRRSGRGRMHRGYRWRPRYRNYGYDERY